jgi:hypothetical protein
MFEGAFMPGFRLKVETHYAQADVKLSTFDKFAGTCIG